MARLVQKVESHDVTSASAWASYIETDEQRLVTADDLRIGVRFAGPGGSGMVFAISPEQAEAFYAELGAAIGAAKEWRDKL